jgi:hypothetical protein
LAVVAFEQQGRAVARQRGAIERDLAEVVGREAKARLAAVAAGERDRLADQVEHAEPKQHFDDAVLRSELDLDPLVGELGFDRVALGQDQQNAEILALHALGQVERHAERALGAGAFAHQAEARRRDRIADQRHRLRIAFPASRRFLVERAIGEAIGEAAVGPQLEPRRDLHRAAVVAAGEAGRRGDGGRGLDRRARGEGERAQRGQ